MYPKCLFCLSVCGVWCVVDNECVYNDNGIQKSKFAESTEYKE